MNHALALNIGRDSMTTPITKPKITNEFLRAISKRTCPHCDGKRTLRWDYDGGQVVCMICARQPGRRWGDRGITGSSSSVEEHGVRGQTVSSVGNSGNISRMPTRRDAVSGLRHKAEVEPKPRSDPIEAVTPHIVHRKPQIHAWTGFITWGIATRPLMCIWPDCENQSSQSIHCIIHRGEYIQEFGIKPVNWKHMRLWDKGGEVTVEWTPEKLHTIRKGGNHYRVRIMKITIPQDAPRYGYKGKSAAWVQAREAFNAAMEHRVIGFNDALKQALSERDMRGVERETW